MFKDSVYRPGDFTLPSSFMMDKYGALTRGWHKELHPDNQRGQRALEIQIQGTSAMDRITNDLKFGSRCKDEGRIQIYQMTKKNQEVYYGKAHGDFRRVNGNPYPGKHQGPFYAMNDGIVDRTPGNT